MSPVTNSAFDEIYNLDDEALKKRGTCVDNGLFCFFDVFPCGMNVVDRSVGMARQALILGVYMYVFF